MFKFTSCVLLNGSSLSFVVFGIHQAKLGSGRLMGPKGVSVDQNGHVIVVDNKACTVFIFQLTGKLITKFGSRGNGDKQFAGNSEENVKKLHMQLKFKALNEVEH